MKLRLSVHGIVTDLKADSRARDLDDEEDFDEDEKGLEKVSKASREPRQTRTLSNEMLKAIYYTLSVTSWTRRRPQPLFPRGENGDEMMVMVDMYSMTEWNKTKVVKEENVFPTDRNNFKNTKTPVANELVVRRNEPDPKTFLVVK